MAEEGRVIVIDNGTYRCKAGFAGDEEPRTVFPPIIGKLMHYDSNYYLVDIAKGYGEQVRSPLQAGLVTDWEDMQKVWQYACKNELHIAPEEHPFLLSEPPLTPKQSTEKLVQVLFESFSVPALNVSNTAVLALLASGRTTGCVLDCGYAVAYSVPIFEGLTLPYATLKSELGGRDLSDYLAEWGRSPSQRDTQIYLLRRAIRFRYPNSSYRSKLPDNTEITVNPEITVDPEVLFQPSLLGKETYGLHQLLPKSIKRCSTEIRKDMYMNIVLSGGSSMFPGLRERVAGEIAEKAPGEQFKVEAPPERIYSTWIGGSILGSLNCFPEKCVSKQEYEEVGPAVVHRRFF